MLTAQRPASKAGTGIPGGSTPLLSAERSGMNWFILFGRKHCKVCSTATIVKRDGKYVCTNVNHAANVARAATRQTAAKATAGRPRRTTGTGRTPVLCPACNTPMNRFMTPAGLRYKCMNPGHARRAAVRDRARQAKKRKTWRKKKKQ